jgi:hypothetical protein
MICCCLDSAYTFVDQYKQNFGKFAVIVKAWEVCSYSKSIDGIDFKKNLSRGSLFWEGDLYVVKFVSCCHLDSTYICWLMYMKLWEVVSYSKSRDGMLLRKICQGDNFLGGGFIYISWVCCRQYGIVGRRGVSWACSLKVRSLWQGFFCCLIFFNESGAILFQNANKST